MYDDDDSVRMLEAMRESIRENQRREELEMMREELVREREHYHEQRAFEDARRQHELEALQYQQYAQFHQMSADEINMLKERVKKPKTEEHFDEDLFEI